MKAKNTEGLNGGMMLHLTVVFEPESKEVSYSGNMPLTMALTLIPQIMAQIQVNEALAEAKARDKGQGKEKTKVK